MGISDQAHFSWLKEAVAPVREEIRRTLPQKAQVLGLGEQSPSPFLVDLLEGLEYSYQACDLFPRTAQTIACDMNDLSPLFGKMRADIVCLFRSSYFIKNKGNFFGQLKQVMAPGGYLFIDLLIGSSDLPVLDFRYGDTAAAFAYDVKRPAHFQTSFYDDRLVKEFPAEVEAFCRHARRWPLATQINYLRRAHRHYWQDANMLKRLTSKNLGTQMKQMLPEQNLLSLTDFESEGFEIAAFNSRYFYPQVKKFNLYSFVAARLKPSGSAA